jgi:hypothetical protein
MEDLMKDGKSKRKWDFGAESKWEKDIVQDILYLRDEKKLTCQQVADFLNAQSRFPRRAPKWTCATIRYFYVRNAPEPIIQKRKRKRP